jgi:hypothetical protein
MADDYFRLRHGSRAPAPRRDSAAEVQYLLGAEEQLFHSISARLPLPEILHKICDALNFEIGNMVSLVSLPNDDADGLATIVKSAATFGLYRFCSAAVLGGDDEVLGSIEMYGCVPRRPFLSEVRLIERATCLAAIAITRHNEAGHGGGAPTLVRRVPQHDA